MSGLRPVLPRVDRDDVRIVSVDEWDADSVAAQGGLADTIVDRWTQRPWRDDLMSVSVFTSLEEVVDARLLRGTDSGPTRPAVKRWRVVTYTQWAGERGGPVAGHRTPDREGPGGAEQPRTVEYSYYRSHYGQEPQPNLAAGASCVLFVTVDFDGADRQRQHAWIDAVLAALEAEPEPAPGLLAAHFHTSNDGIRVLNYAEWTTAEAHRDALNHGGDGIGQADLPEWRVVRQFLGIRANTVGRYTLHCSLDSGTTKR